MNISREEKKKEAIERMKLLGIYNQTRLQFEHEDLVSESCPPLGACFWVSEEQKQRIREYEEESGALIYFGIRSYTTMGEMESYLFVSDCKEEWKYERKYLKEGQPDAYVYNCTEPLFSDTGSIGIERTPAAGLRRTW